VGFWRGDHRVDGGYDQDKQTKQKSWFPGKPENAGKAQGKERTKWIKKRGGDWLLNRSIA
jgi:hypothetical protein